MTENLKIFKDNAGWLHLVVIGVDQEAKKCLHWSTWEKTIGGLENLIIAIGAFEDSLYCGPEDWYKWMEETYANVEENPQNRYIEYKNLKIVPGAYTEIDVMTVIRYYAHSQNT